MKNKNKKMDWAAFDALTDEDIAKGVANDPDTFLTDEAFWEDAEVIMPEIKQQVTLKLDPTIVNYFKKMGKGYQTRINAVLKTYVENMEKKTKHA